jgi:hypothetical protein
MNFEYLLTGAGLNQCIAGSVDDYIQKALP